MAVEGGEAEGLKLDGTRARELTVWQRDEEVLAGVSCGAGESMRGWFEARCVPVAHEVADSHQSASIAWLGSAAHSC